MSRVLPALCGALAAAAVAAADDAGLARCAAIADGPARLACYDALAGRPPEPAAAPAGPAVATPEEFGLPRAPLIETQLRARIAGSLTEWQRGTLLKLDNGQVWKVLSDGSAYYPNLPDDAEVTIEKGVFGSYWMEIRSINRKIKVKRIS